MGYLSSLPALQAQAPDTSAISRGLGMLAQVGDNMRQQQAQQERLGYLAQENQRQNEQMKLQQETHGAQMEEHKMQMHDAVGKWLYKTFEAAGPDGPTEEQWGQIGNTLRERGYEPYLDGPLPDYAHRDKIIPSIRSQYGPTREELLDRRIKEATATKTEAEAENLQGGGPAQTDIGKLNADLKAGRITQDQHDARVNRLTGGGQPGMTTQQRNDLGKAQASTNYLNGDGEHPGAIDAYVDFIQKSGPSVFIAGTEQNAQLNTLRQDLLLTLKEMPYNLGVLNGPDERLLNNVIGDPLGSYNPLSAWNYKALAKTRAVALKDLIAKRLAAVKSGIKASGLGGGTSTYNGEQPSQEELDAIQNHLDDPEAIRLFEEEYGPVETYLQ